MDAAAGDFAAPDQSAARYIVEINKRLSFEKTLPYVRHAILNDRFILGVCWPGRIGQKAPVVGVLQKGTVEPRCVGIGLIDTSFHPVDDNTVGTTTKKLPDPFEAIDDRGQILFENGDHAAEPAVTERQDEALHHTRLAAAEFLQWAQPAEVGFPHFARKALGPPHADRGGTSESTTLPCKSI